MNLQEKYELGQKFLNSFTKENVFDGIKDIVKKYIQDEEDLKLLEECDSYKIEISHSNIYSLGFYFGNDWECYYVFINPTVFSIRQQEEYAPFIKTIVSIRTYIINNK